jgi:hypothetical protein
MPAPDEPRHPVLPDAWRYEIIGFRFERPLDESEPFLDLTLCAGAGADVRRLRFWSPRDIAVAHGFTFTGGLVILDIRAQGLDRLGVRVDDYENHQSSVRFWARTVEDVTAELVHSPA